jgi:hypothetical protein
MINVVFFDDTIDIFTTIIVFLLGVCLINILAPSFKATKTRALGLYIWHSIFCIIYAIISLRQPADSTTYYILSKGSFDFELGTNAVVYFIRFFSDTLSYLGVFMIFNIFGSIGLLAVDASLRHVTENKSSFVKFLVIIVVLLPSMNFWTGAIGKDSIAYMSTGLILWASINFKQNFSLIFIAFVCMFLVRPHIAAIMVFAFAFSLLLTKISTLKRIFFIIISLIAITKVLPIVFQYLMLDQADSLQSYIDVRQGYNMSGGASLDIRSLSIFNKIFTHGFRPLPYEAHNFLSFMSSIDNMLLLIVFSLSLFSALFLKGKKFSLNLSHPKENRWFLLIFSLSVMIASSMITSNLGISVRQKWMYMPILLYFMFLIMKVRWSNPNKF